MKFKESHAARKKKRSTSHDNSKKSLIIAKPETDEMQPQLLKLKGIALKNKSPAKVKLGKNSGGQVGCKMVKLGQVSRSR